MKFHLKIILLPTIVMTAIFAVSMVVIEFHQKNLLKEQLERELTALSSFALSAVEMVSYDYDPNSHDSSFDLLADKIAAASSYRISYFFETGQMLGDSNLSFSRVRTIENHADRPEIQQALNNEFGKSQRYSKTVKQEMVYLAKYDEKTGFIARVSLPENTYNKAIVNLRWGFSVIVAITVIMIVIFCFFAIKLNHQALRKERKLQATRIRAQTKQLTLIQAMSTMLNSAHSIDDASRLIATIFPQLLPSFSGAIYIGEKQGQTIKELTHWGNEWPDEVSVIITSALKQEMESEFCTSFEQRSNKINTSSSKELSISLSCGNGFYGLLYLVNSQAHTSKKHQKTAIDVAEQLAFALSNLHTKDQLRSQATRDPLTDLYNRRYMIEAFDQAFHRAERHQTKLAFIILDLDHFKSFNDEFGHDAGDHVLTLVAQTLKENLRIEDIACRYGGEEFCIISPDSSLKEGYQLAEKIRLCIMALDLTHNGRSLGKLTTSIGVSIYPNHGGTIDELIYHADRALYQAKENGRNKTEVFQQSTSTFENSML